MDDEKSRREDVEQATEEEIEKEKRSGQAWQEREMRMAQDVATGEESMSDVGGKLVSDAFTGQKADEILGDPPFEAASSSILDQPLLVVYQDPQFVELSDKYHYARPDGTELALGEQTNQGVARKALRAVSSLDSLMKTVVEVTQDGQKVFAMERKGSVGKNTMVITDAEGREVGEVRQTKRGPRRASFALIAGGQELATMQTGRLNAGQGYDIVGPDGELIAYVRRLFEGVLKNIARGMKSSADNYALRVARPLTDPLRTLVVATPMSVDSAINQRDDGFKLRDLRRAVRRFT